jgi:hypothetical protein
MLGLSKKTPWLLVHKGTIPTERPPLVGEVSANFLRIEGVTWSTQWIPTAVNIGFLDRGRYFSIQVAPQLSSWGWMDPVPEPLLLRKSGSTGNRRVDSVVKHISGRIAPESKLSWISHVFLEKVANTITNTKCTPLIALSSFINHHAT